MEKVARMVVPWALDGSLVKEKDTFRPLPSKATTLGGPALTHNLTQPTHSRLLPPSRALLWVPTTGGKGERVTDKP